MIRERNKSADNFLFALVAVLYGRLLRIITVTSRGLLKRFSMSIRLPSPRFLQILYVFCLKCLATKVSHISGVTTPQRLEVSRV